MPRLKSAKATEGQGDLLAGATDTETKTGSGKKAKPKRLTAAGTNVVPANGNLPGRALKKHVGAIHTDGQLSLLQRKLSNVLLLNAYDALLTETEHEIDEKTLCLMLGYDSNDRKPLKAALRALATIPVEWNLLADSTGEEEEWGVATLMAQAVLSRGRCRYSYAPALAQKLYNPSIYASINMRIQRKFRSGHALALYENCYRFVRVGSTGWWDLQTFRRLMGVEGSDYYKQFKHLNAKIIKPVVKEINRLSNIEITPEFQRKGRSIAKIRFIITPNAQLPLTGLDNDDLLNDHPTYRRLRAAGIADKLAKSWLAEHGAAYVDGKMDLVEAQKKSSKIVNLRGFLTAAIRDDYAIDEDQGQGRALTAEERERAVAYKKKKAEAESKRRQETEQRDQAKKERKRQIDEARAHLSSLGEEEGQRLLAAFQATLDKPFLRADFLRSGIEAPAVALALWDFLDLS